MAASKTGQLAVQQIEVANGGVDLVSAPETTSKGHARTLSNFLVDRPGKLVPRGPLVGAALGAGVDTVGAFATPAALMLSKLDTSVSSRQIFPWESHLGLPNRTTSNETDLVRASVNLRAVDKASFGASDQAMSDIGLVPGPRCATLGGLIYAISLDSSGELAGGDTVTLPDGTSKARKTELLAISPLGAALPTFPNPDLATTASWTPGANTTLSIANVNANLGTPLPARSVKALQLAVTSGPSQDVVASTVLAGTFKTGVTYTISFRIATSSGPVPAFCSITGEASPSVPADSTAFRTFNYTFTPASDHINPTFVIHGIELSSVQMWVYGFTITQVTTNKFGGNGPVAAQDVAAYLERIFALGGVAPGDSTYSIKSRTLWWTDPGGAPSRTLAQWQDDVSGLTNQLEVGDDDPTDPGVALGVLPSQLLVFGRRSLWTVLGSSPSNFVVRRVDTVGCLDPRSVIEYEGAVYWLSEQGFMRYDGSSLVNMSRAIQPSLLAAADQAVGVGGVAGGTAVVTVLPNGYLLLAIGRRDTDTQLFSGLLHVPTGAWTLLSSAAQVGTIRGTLQNSGNSYIVDASTLWLLNGATHPERNPLADKGATLSDVSRDSIITLLGSAITVASSAQIKPLWQSRLIQLSSPIYASQLVRYMHDYVWLDPNEIANDQSLGWYITIYSAKDVSLADFTLPTSAGADIIRDLSQPLPAASRRRATMQTFGEANSDIYIELGVNDPTSGPQWSIAEIYPGAVEFQTTRHRAAE